MTGADGVSKYVEEPLCCIKKIKFLHKVQVEPHTPPPFTQSFNLKAHPEIQHTPEH